MTKLARGERDQFGRLNVTDEELFANARGAFIAASLSTEAIMVLLGCDASEANSFKEGACADMWRIKMMVGSA
jgi:hypothetical protein